MPRRRAPPAHRRDGFFNQCNFTTPRAWRGPCARLCSRCTGSRVAAPRLLRRRLADRGTPSSPRSSGLPPRRRQLPCGRATSSSSTTCSGARAQPYAGPRKIVVAIGRHDDRRGRAPSRTAAAPRAARLLTLPKRGRRRNVLKASDSHSQNVSAVAAGRRRRRVPRPVRGARRRRARRGRARRRAPVGSSPAQILRTTSSATARHQPPRPR